MVDTMDGYKIVVMSVQRVLLKINMLKYDVYVSIIIYLNLQSSFGSLLRSPRISLIFFHFVHALNNSYLRLSSK
jgi:hypothetical protein